jgi:hypothetical protein
MDGLPGVFVHCLYEYKGVVFSGMGQPSSVRLSVMIGNDSALDVVHDLWR